MMACKPVPRHLNATNSQPYHTMQQYMPSFVTSPSAPGTAYSRVTTLKKLWDSHFIMTRPRDETVVLMITDPTVPFMEVMVDATINAASRPGQAPASLKYGACEDVIL
jgi:hypothetical protein